MYVHRIMYHNIAIKSSVTNAPQTFYSYDIINATFIMYNSNRSASLTENDRSAFANVK